MIDVNQLTQQLRLMPDQALQQIAMMYKDDPYILPMVISEDTARKKLRMAAQAQAAQPQGTVKDQAIMSIGREPQPPQQAPDEAGIAALQAPNMENMADGGIAGEPEMSEFDFAQRSEPVVRMAGGGDVARYQTGGNTPFSRSAFGQSYERTEQALQDDLARDRLRSELASMYGRRTALPGMFVRQTDTDKETAEFVDNLLPSLSLPQLQALKQYGLTGIRDVIAEKNPDLFKKLISEAGSRAQPPATSRTRPVPPQGDRPYLSPESQAALQRAEAGSNYYGEAPPVEGQRTVDPRLLAGAATARASGAAPPAGIAALEASGAAIRGAGAGAAPAQDFATRAVDVAKRFFDPEGVKSETDAYTKEVKEDIEKGRERLKEALKKDGPAYAGLEALLKKEEVEAKEGLGKDKAMAILNAGLAMMAGGSPRALENIAKGAMVGTGQYSEALKDFKKSAKERQRAMADIEQARRAEARDDTKTMLAYEDRASTRFDTARQYGMNAVMTVTNARAGSAASVYNTMVQEAGASSRSAAQTASQERIAAANRESSERMAEASRQTQLQIAQLPGAEERLIRAFATDPQFRKAYEELKSIGGDQRAAAELVTKIVTTPGALEQLKVTNKGLYDTINAMITRMGASTIQAVSSSTPPPGARP